MSNATKARPAKSRDAIPVIELWGHLLVPLQGDVSDTQMYEVVDAVLHRISRHGADGLIIDTSGIWIMDSHLCAGLGRLATSASIMGVPTVLCGLTADVVVTLESMGFELTELQTATSLERAMEKLGVFIERRPRPRFHDPRGEQRNDPRYDPRSEPRNDLRSDLRNDPRSDPRNDPRNEPRNPPSLQARPRLREERE
jgi:rsbT antagonist protein RsbS